MRLTALSEVDCDDRQRDLSESKDLFEVVESVTKTVHHWVSKSREEKAMFHHLNVRASIPAKVCHGNFRRVVKEINAKRNQLARNTRRCAAVLLILSVLILSVPPVVAAELAREAAALSSNAPPVIVRRPAETVTSAPLPLEKATA